MIEHIASPDDGNHILGIHRVRTEGIRLAGCGVGGQLPVGNDLSRLGICPVKALLDAPEIGEGNTKGIALFGEQMPVTRLLLEQEARGRDTMTQWYGLDPERIVLVDHFRPPRVERLEADLHRKIGAKEVEQGLEDPFGISMGMDDYFTGTLS